MNGPLHRAVGVLAAASAVAAVGCTVPESEGTAVGNPTLTTMEVATSRDFIVTAADVELADIRLQTCDRAATVQPIDRSIDLLTDTIEVPAGAWCSVILDFSGPLLVDATWGIGEDAGALHLELTVGSLGFAREGGGAIVAAEEIAWAVQLAGEDWLDATELGIGPDDDMQVGPESRHHDALVDRVEADSRLWSDEGGELVAVAGIGPASFNAAAGVSDVAQEGCGCSASGAGRGGLSLLALLAGLFGIRRRLR